MKVSLFWNEKKDAWAIRGHDPRLKGLDGGVIGLGWKVILKNVNFEVGKIGHKKAYENLVGGSHLANIRHAVIKGDLVFWQGQSDHYSFLQEALAQKSPFIWTSKSDEMERGIRQVGAPVRYHPAMGEDFRCLLSVHALTGLPIHQASAVSVGTKEPWIWTEIAGAKSAEETVAANARRLLDEIEPKPAPKAARKRK